MMWLGRLVGGDAYDRALSFGELAVGVGGTRQRGQSGQGGRRWADGQNYGIKVRGDRAAGGSSGQR